VINRRELLKLLGSLPFVGLLFPKAEPVIYKQFVGQKDGVVPPKFKWVLDGELIAAPVPTERDNCIYVRVHSVSETWEAGTFLNIKPGSHYSWPDTVFTRENKYPPLSEAEVASFGLKPRPMPPMGTKVRIELCRYVTSAGYYSYGYCARPLV
jgi:hypothetical protein